MPVREAVRQLEAPHLDDSGFQDATDVNDAMREMVRTAVNPVRFTALNEQFHRILTGPCPNAHLQDLLHREWQRMTMVRRTSFAKIPSRPAKSVSEHDEILRLIRTGSPLNDVELAARDHKLQTMNEFLASQADEDPTTSNYLYA